MQRVGGHVIRRFVHRKPFGKKMKRENITTMRQEDEIPSAKDIIEEQEYNDFLKDLENEIPFE